MALFPQDARFDLVGGRYDVFHEDDCYLIATEETMYNTFPAYACCWIKECADGRLVWEHVPADSRYLDTLELVTEKKAESLLYSYMHLCAQTERELGDDEAAELYLDAAHDLLWR